MNEEIADLFLNRSQNAVNLAVANIENKPDEAAEALHLERVSGTPAVAIEPDLELVKNQQKARYAAQIVRNNPYITDYVDSHPLASKVSNDDYANLDQLSQTAKKFGSRSVLGAAIEGFEHGFNAEGLSKEYGDLLAMSDSPVWKAFIQTAGLVPLGGRMFMNAFGGAVHAVGGAAGAFAEQQGMEPAWANRFTRDVVAGLNVAMAGQGGLHLHPKVRAEFDKIADATRAAKPYLESGVEPPVGIHPEIDKLHVEQSKVDLKNFDELSHDADKALTKVRSPELFKQYMEQHFPDQRIGISGERIAKLYKDKEPAPGDNLLGWVPDIAEQLRVAKETGGDVQVPLAEWLARVEPELAKELHDDIRVRPNGLTKNEGMVVSEYAQLDVEGNVPITPLEAVRTQASLDPLLQRQAEGWSKQDFAKSAKLFQTEKRSIGTGSDVMVPKEGWFPYEQKAIDAANDVLNRILPQGDKFEAVPSRGVNVQGQRAVGAYVSYTDRIPLIAYLVNPDTAVGTVRHEAIHFLRNQGFFTKEEWQALKDAAFNNDWIDKHDIKERYQGKSAVAMIEEAIAEEFKVWRHDPVEEGLVNRIFAKLSRLADSVRDAVTKAMGGQIEANEIFKRIESGEIGSRKDTKPLDPRTFAELEETDKKLFAKANSIGMTVPQYKKYIDLIEKRNKEDMEAQFKRAQELERKQQTKEWKEEYATTFEEVKAGILVRPDVAAARFFIEGKYGEQEFQPKPRIRTEDLTPEQQNALPRNFQSSKGYPLDEISTLFGYADPQMMVKKLVEMDDLRAGMRFGDVVDGLIKEATDQKMQEKFGDLKQNILDEAYGHVLSKTQMDLLHEETVALGTQAGAFETPYTKQDVLAWVNKHFSDLPLTTTKMDKFIREAGKAGKEAELALLKGDAAEAFKQKQRQYLAFALGNEAKKLEKDLRRFEKTAERFSKRIVQGISQEYTDFAQTLLKSVGSPVRRSMEELRDGLVHHGYGSFREFVGAKYAEGRELAVADYIQDGQVKPLDQMKVSEFREFKDAIDSLSHVGKEEKMVEVAGKRMQLEELKSEVLTNIRELPIQDPKSAVRLLYKWDAELTKMEEVIKDLDLRKEGGPLFNSLVRPLVNAKIKEYEMLDKLSKEMEGLKRGFGSQWRDTLKATIPNDFLIDPYWEKPFDITRSDMIGIMLNFGNRSNIEKFTRGFAGKEAKVLEGKLWELFDKHATKEDWQYTQKIWDMFETWREESDSMYRRLSGVPPKWIEVSPVTTKHGDFKGGYFPIIYDKLRSNQDVILQKSGAGETNFNRDYIRATTGAGYAKARTGYVDYIQFEDAVGQIAGRMQQMVHDISHREAVINAGKIIYDRGIASAIKKHYGEEYQSQLDHWLKDIANHFNIKEQSTSAANSLMRTFRFNLVSNALGLNLKVILSPNPGLFNPRNAAEFWMNRGDNMALAMQHSQEIPHIMRSLDRDFREKLERTMREKNWSQVQSEAFRLSFYPMVMLERELRAISFTSEFKDGLRAGKTEADSAAWADSIIRERQGTAGTMDLPAIMRSNEAMKMATMFYGFFNTMYNWQRQLPGQARRGEYQEGMKTIYGAILLPAAISYGLFYQPKEGESIFKGMAKALIGQPLSTLPWVREAANYFLEGFPSKTPWENLFTAAGSVVSDIKKYKEGKRVDKPIQHGVNLTGLTLGLPLGQVARTGQFGYDVATARQRPKNIVEWWRGVVTGDIKLKK